MAAERASTFRKIVRRLALMLGALAVIGLATSAVAQTTQPSDTAAASANEAATPAAPVSKSAWSATIAAFADALVNAPTSSTAEPFLCDDVLIRQFGTARRDSIISLREKTLGTLLMTHRAYATTPAAMASDLANDVREFNLPDSVKRRFTPADDREARRANDVAAKWVTS